MNKIILSPSIMCADLMHIDATIKRLQGHGFESLHVDVMDLHFVPNLTLGFDFINQLTRYKMPRDIHLMVEEPLEAMSNFNITPTDIIYFHIEAKSDIAATIEQIIINGGVPGLAISPGTPVMTLAPWIDSIGAILLMSVNPGFAGQGFLPESYSRAREINKLIGKRKLILGVDGGIGYEQMKKFRQVGVSLFVLGTTVLFKGDIENNCDEVRKFSETLAKVTA